MYHNTSLGRFTLGDWISDDAASEFPLNRPTMTAVMATTTVTDDTISDNGSGFTVPLVCVNCLELQGIFFDSNRHICQTWRTNRASRISQILLFLPLTLVTLSTILPASLAHSRKSALVLGNPVLATVPANSDSHPPSPGLAGAKPVVGARGGLMEKEVRDSLECYL